MNAIEKLLGSAIVVVIVVLLVLTSCSEETERTEYNKYRAKEREVMKIYPEQQRESYSSGGAFFLFGIGGGGYSSKEEAKDYVYMAWKKDDGSFALGKYEMNIVSVRLDDTALIPRVKITPSYFWFQGSPSKFESTSLEHVERIEIITHPKYWKMKITLPMEEKK